MSTLVYDPVKQKMVAVAGAGNVPISSLSSISTGKVLGRTTAGTGQVEQLSAAQLKTLLDIVGVTAAALNAKAPLASPDLTGTPTAPTASTATSTTQIATTAFVQAVVSALVNSSPAALDTLNELAAALGNDPNFATTIATALGLKAPLASPALTGTPTAPTASTATSTTQIATTAFVQAVVAAINSALPNTAQVERASMRVLSISQMDGLIDFLQASLSTRHITYFLPVPNSTALPTTILGSLSANWAVNGTLQTATVSASSKFAMQPRIKAASSSAANSVAGFRHINKIWAIGNGSFGGFFASFRVGVSDALTGVRQFFGMTADNSGLTNYSPASKINMIGFGCEAGDTALNFYCNGSGFSSVSLGASFPAHTTETVFYQCYIYASRAGSISWEIVNMLDGTRAYSVVTITTPGVDAPDSSTLLTFIAWRTSHTQIAQPSITKMGFYCESFV